MVSSLVALSLSESIININSEIHQRITYSLHATYSTLKYTVLQCSCLVSASYIVLDRVFDFVLVKN